MTRTRALLVALATLVATGCTTEKKEEGPVRPVKFAVIGAPEVGENDDDLAAAIGKLSREPDLDFVLVPGPLLAKGATPLALELLKNDLGQLAPPVYVSFAAVESGTSALKAEEILTALEKMGPGDEHAVAYSRTPSRTPKILVNVVGPDGKSKLDKAPEGKRVIQLGPGPGPDLAVVLAPGSTVVLPSSLASPILGIPALAKGKQYVLVTIWSGRTEVQPVALEGPNPPALEIR
jgi:hypothetical protein